MVTPGFAGGKKPSFVEMSLSFGNYSWKSRTGHKLTGYLNTKKYTTRDAAFKVRDVHWQLLYCPANSATFQDVSGVSRSCRIIVLIGPPKLGSFSQFIQSD
eukprot:sb/3478536/